MIKNIWTIEEDKILISAKINGYTYKKIQEELLPNRTVNSVRVRGSILVNRGELISDKIRVNKTWSQAEEEKLITLRINSIGYKEIAKLLNRTESSVKNKMSLISKPIKDLEERKLEIINAIKKYPTKNRYSGRYYYKFDIPSFQEINDIFGSWEIAKEKAKIPLPFSDNIPTILYYIKIIKGTNIYYKIGITTKNVLDRFKKENNIKIEILREKIFKSNKEARVEENVILNTFKQYKTTDKVLDYGGNTEIFKVDIFNLHA